MLFAACAKDNITKPGTYTLTGRVRLVGALRNAVGPYHDPGDSTDVQRVENADSVRVYLYQGSTRKDSTMRSPTGSANEAFNRSRHSTKRPLAR